MEGEAARHSFKMRQHMNHRGQILINIVQQAQRIAFTIFFCYSVFRLCYVVLK